jgi:hypothetical protein
MRWKTMGTTIMTMIMVVATWAGTVTGISLSAPVFSCWDPSVYRDILPERLVGEYVQVYSSKYLRTTSLIGLDCVEVTVTEQKTGVLTVTQRAIQHEHKQMPVVKTRTFSGWGQNTSAVPWTDGEPGPSLVFNVPGYLLRCAWPVDAKGPDVVIWTGLDNLAMEVWTTNATRYAAEWKDAVGSYLATIEYKGGYKTPVVTYDKDVCDV